MKKRFSVLLLSILLLLTACTPVQGFVMIVNGDSCILEVGDTVQLTAVTEHVDGEVVWESDSDCVDVNGEGLVTALSAGVAKVRAVVGKFADSIEVTVKEVQQDPDVDPEEELVLRAEKYSILPGERTRLSVEGCGEEEAVIETVRGAAYASCSGFTVTGITAGGTAAFVATCGDRVSNEVEIKVVASGVSPTSIALTADTTQIKAGETAHLSFTLTPSSAAGNISYHLLEGGEYAEIVGDALTVSSAQPVTVVGTVGDVVSNAVTFNITEPTSDPYVNVSASRFYASYEPADSAADAYYRTRHNLMSGDIAEQDQEPTLASHRPMLDGVYLRNSAAIYSEDGDTYYVLGSDGTLADKIYRDGAYVTLEEVAAYLMAFGDIPANYTSDKSGSPSSDPWGKYLRLNHSYFSGNTSNYPYEPLLPDIRGGGGTLSYYEIDVGTTGTDCDPGYAARPYNTGSKITRGAARLVYTRYGSDGREISDVNKKYVFYTYNHYNDFQEYLNYQGGWGEMFGNITGGGSISSKYDYNPTDYVPILKRSFLTLP